MFTAFCNSKQALRENLLFLLGLLKQIQVKEPIAENEEEQAEQEQEEEQEQEQVSEPVKLPDEAEVASSQFVFS